MIDAVWLHVLQRIPADLHDTLAAVTTTGTELVIQQIFKLERDFMVVRARTAGTMDTGRTIIVAYAQIDFLAFNKKLDDGAVEAMFAEPMPELAAPMSQAVAVSAPTPMPVSPAVAPKPVKPAAAPPPAAAAPKPETTPATPQADPADGKAAHISKTILLARLRERLAEKAK